MTEPLLHVEDLTKYFPVTRGVLGKKVGDVRAVDGVSFDIAEGETLGLVGESGSGKTTVGRSILRLIEPTSGRVTFDGLDITHAKQRDLASVRRNLQVIFQDPYSSLNPRMRVVDIVGEALEVHGIATGAAVEARVRELLGRVGLSQQWINRYPHEFSGGQRQRIGVARAIALDPKLIVCDEAVSALDVSIQAQVINLLVDLRREMGLSYLFIAHDLSVVRHISQRVAVMYLGQLVELATSKRLFQAPAHPYTRALLSAIPVPIPGRERRRIVLHGDVPSPLDPPAGCRFHTRCPAVFDRCRSEEPQSVAVEEGHTVKCFHAYDLDAGRDWYATIVERIERATATNESAAGAPAQKPVIAARARTVRRNELRRTRERPTETDVDRAAAARPPLIIGAAVFGGLLLALGFYFFGLVILLPTYFVFVRSTLRSRHTADLFFAGAVVICVFAGTAVTRHAARHRAQQEISRLGDALRGRQKATHSLPSDLSELGWRLYPIFEDGHAVDPWGRGFVYRVHADGTTFDLCSVGADGVPSGDDVGQSSRCATDARADTSH